MKTIFTFLLALGIPAQAAPVPSSPASSEAECPSAREFITTLRYLRDDKALEIPEKQAQELAFEVAKGCQGAAQRFIKVNQVLLKSGVLGKNSVESAKLYARETDANAEAFLNVFTHAYASDRLDLSMQEALSIATALSKDFEGNASEVQKDFVGMVEFCVKRQQGTLSIPACAQMVQRVLKKASPFAGQMAGPFQKLSSFLLEKQNVDLPQALSILEAVASQGPQAVQNFMDASEFASSEKGLKLSPKDSLAFAQKIAVLKPLPSESSAKSNSGKQ